MCVNISYKCLSVSIVYMVSKYPLFSGVVACVYPNPLYSHLSSIYSSVSIYQDYAQFCWGIRKLLVCDCGTDHVLSRLVPQLLRFCAIGRARRRFCTTWVAEWSLCCQFIVFLRKGSAAAAVARGASARECTCTAQA